MLSELDTGSAESSSTESFEHSEDPLGLKKGLKEQQEQEEQGPSDKPLSERQRLKIARSEARARGELVDGTSSEEEAAAQTSEEASGTEDPQTASSSSSSSSSSESESESSSSGSSGSASGEEQDDAPVSRSRSDDDLAEQLSSQLALLGDNKLTSHDIKMIKRSTKRNLESKHGVESTSDGEDLDRLLSQVSANIEDDEEELRDKFEEAAEKAQEAMGSAQAALEQKKRALMAAQEANKALTMATAAADAVLTTSSVLAMDAALSSGPTASVLNTPVPSATVNTTTAQSPIPGVAAGKTAPTTSTSSPSTSATSATPAAASSSPAAPTSTTTAKSTSGPKKTKAPVAAAPKDSIPPPPTPKM